MSSDLAKKKTLKKERTGQKQSSEVKKTLEKYVSQNWKKKWKTNDFSHFIAKVRFHIKYIILRKKRYAILLSKSFFQHQETSYL